MCLNLWGFDPDLGTDTIYLCPQDSITDITPTVSGGCPCTFSWDNNWPFKDRYMVKPGSYDLSIWDKHGCGYVKHYEVIKLPSIYIYYSTFKPSCTGYNDGYFYFEVIGGKPPYRYFINGTEVYSTVQYNLKSGTYNLRVLDCNGCQQYSNIIVPEADDKPFSTLDITTICNKLYVNVYGDYEPYSLELNGYNMPAFIEIKDTLTYNLKIISNKMCEYDTTIPVKDIVEFSVDDIAIVEPNCELINDGSITITESDNVKYEWSHIFEDTNNLTSLEPGDYYLTITNLDNKCEINYHFELDYRNPACVIVPNAISPNNDGINDLWEIENLNILYPNCKVYVYNRWGQLVFKSEGYNDPWDGKTEKGYQAPFDSYHYIIEIEGEKSLTGQINILR